jgi:hypothetical protein
VLSEPGRFANRNSGFYTPQANARLQRFSLTSLQASQNKPLQSVPLNPSGELSRVTVLVATSSENTLETKPLPIK